MTALASPCPAPDPLNDVSPFRHHLDTYYAPTADELVQLGDLVAAQQDNMDKIDAEIERLKGQITCLVERKQPISNFITKHIALMNPIRRLPAEVLQEIFMNCLNPDSAGSMHLADAPMVLTLVCKLWREAALRAPGLWCNTHIPIRDLTDEAAIARNLVGIKAWLSRSKSLPLAIRVIELFPDCSDSGAMTPSRGREFSSGVFDILYSHVARWQHLHLVTTRWGGDPYFRIPPAELESLRSVWLQLNATAFMDEESTKACRSLPSAGFFHCPTLRDFNVVSASVPQARSILSLPIPWGNLASLTLSDAAPIVDVPHFLNLLFSSGNVLEKIRFGIRRPEPYSFATSETSVTTPEPGKIFTFPRLRIMEITERPGVDARWFGHAIRCPILEELEYHSVSPGYSTRPNYATSDSITWDEVNEDPIEDSDAEVTGFDNSLISIVAHSGAFIHTLTFDPELYTSSQVLTTLACCPNLHTLIMAHAYNRSFNVGPPSNPANKSLLQAFVSPYASMTSEQVLCPLLSTFVCHGVGDLTLEDFVTFLRVKQSGSLVGVERLRRTMVEFQEEDEPGLHQEAISLVPGGSSNAAFVFLKAPSVSVSLRDGLWLVPEKKHWHSFEPDQFFLR